MNQPRRSASLMAMMSLAALATTGAPEASSEELYERPPPPRHRPVLGGGWYPAREYEPPPKSEADQERISAAEAKRARKNARAERNERRRLEARKARTSMNKENTELEQKIDRAGSTGRLARLRDMWLKSEGLPENAPVTFRLCVADRGWHIETTAKGTTVALSTAKATPAEALTEAEANVLEWATKAVFDRRQAFPENVRKKAVP